MRPVVALVLLAACATQVSSRPVAAAPSDQRGPALAALRAGRFADARRVATGGLAHAPQDAQLAAIRAVATYVAAADALAGELRAVSAKADALHYFDHEQGRAIWLRFLGQLDAVDKDLAVAAADPGFSLELCLACWPEHDWNHNGRIDDGDRKLLQVDRDELGHELPEGDPRRTPTFRFDAGDVLWARAMISFQHAGSELVLAYRWSELDKLFLDDHEPEHGPRFTLHLIDKDRVTHARADLVAGLAYSAAEREAYLAETDDDREWVPSPRQHSHPMPLAVDDALYQHWSELLRDVGHLLDSSEGISLREVAGAVGAGVAALVPDAYLDLGAMFREPSDIVLDVSMEPRTPADTAPILKGLLGHGYAEHMRASPLVGRLMAMVASADHGGGDLEQKLEYLLWLN